MLHGALETTSVDAVRFATMDKQSRYLTEINYVAVAVDLIGGIVEASAKLGVSRRTIFTWLKTGTLRNLPYEDVKRVADACGLSIDKLTREPPTSSRRKGD
jgi:hypothetical protein